MSIFGGPAWTRVVEPDGNPGQWYLHLFDAEQPDLNWENPEVFDDLEKTLRFWLERGIDGFRIDVAHGMAKPPGLPDMEVIKAEVLLADMDDDPRFNNDGVHEIHRQIRAVFNDYPTLSRSARCGCTTTNSSPGISVPTSFTSASISGCCARISTPTTSAGAIENSLPRRRSRAPHRPGRWPITTSTARSTRYGGGTVGLARAWAMALVMLALPGAVFIYNGEELGLPNVELPDEALRDPVWERSGHTRRGRDACRVPVPWDGDAPPFGFSANPDTWLPIPPEWATLTVEKQLPKRIRRCRSSGGQSNCGTTGQNSVVQQSSGSTLPSIPWCFGSPADWCAH